ncbi:alpha/beta fold hydrolase [Nonomuraea diastatica]|uniref:Alpha/beta hydrolase n=1 Tax=Nonomuraea diastatica TaxID=1848329 RepID=A0A4V2YFJ2_9ACTN|nr:alpha/beta hydrolase [Nonomuraea diastatica]TDD23377.1 alpha/beta hydrolase [Nonomuraea diastatica]
MTGAFDRTAITCPEGPLSVITAGQRGAPVVLLSGGGQNNALLSWRHLILALATDYRVFALDWPKQGHSRPWNGIANHTALMRLITVVLDHFDLEKVTLVGQSQGGTLSLAYAIEHPGRVKQLVAMAPAITFSFPPVVQQLVWLVTRSRFLTTTVPSLMLRSRAGVERYMRNTLLPGPVDDFDAIVDEYVEDIRLHGNNSSDWQKTAIGFRASNVDLRPRLGEITCPALFIQGGKDVYVRPSSTIAAAAQVPGSQLEILEDAGHWANRQCHRRVNALVRDFLSQDSFPTTTSN